MHQVDRGPAQLQREVGELVCLDVAGPMPHLTGDLGDPALDPQLLGLEQVRPSVSVSERPLEVRPGRIVSRRRARDDRVELVAQRAEIDGHGSHAKSDYHARPTCVTWAARTIFVLARTHPA